MAVILIILVTHFRNRIQLKLSSHTHQTSQMQTPACFPALLPSPPGPLRTHVQAHMHTHGHRSVQNELCPSLKTPCASLFLYLSTGCSLCFVPCLPSSLTSRASGSEDHPLPSSFPQALTAFADTRSLAWVLPMPSEMAAHRFIQNQAWLSKSLPHGSVSLYTRQNPPNARHQE